MSMSQKDYIKVASIIHDAIENARIVGGASRASVVEVGMRLADMFAADNPRFDRDRFYEAAGLIRSRSLLDGNRPMNSHLPPLT